MPKIAADALTVFAVGPSGSTKNLLCHTEECEIEVEASDEDAACINEVDDFPVAVSRARAITASGKVNTSAVAIELMEAASLNVTFNVVAGSVTYSGNALMSLGSLRIGRKALQSQRFRLKVQGKPTVLMPS